MTELERKAMRAAVDALSPPRNAEESEALALLYAAERADGQWDTVHCPNCGTPTLRREAVQDEGEYKSEEEGRTFYYCSTDCREAH